jgi:hypothetical protein
MRMRQRKMEKAQGGRERIEGKENWREIVRRSDATEWEREKEMGERGGEK